MVLDVFATLFMLGVQFALGHFQAALSIVTGRSKEATEEPEPDCGYEVWSISLPGVRLHLVSRA